ncbi:MAG: nucleotide exchange factor GrpE [Burkholderiales bacterium]
MNDDNNAKRDVKSEYDMENSVEHGEADNGAAETNEQPVKDSIKENGKENHKKNKEIAKLEKALADAIEERDSYKDSYQRTFSDYNNYKKRNQALAAQAMKAGTCEAIGKILPVVDNLERALEHTDENSDDPFAKGVLMVYKQLKDVLASLGVKEIPALGCEFDPNVHEAIQQVEAQDGQAPGTVAAVALKGYMLDDHILRHSMVIVNK